MATATVARPDPGVPGAGALIQGAALLVLLAGLMTVFVANLPGPQGDGPGELFPQPGDPGRGLPPILASSRPATHLVVLVDAPAALINEATFARELDADTGWIASVEVVEATGALLLGLDEALATTAATCPFASCPALAVLDLRTGKRQR